jgi:hypothetical protein
MKLYSTIIHLTDSDENVDHLLNHNERDLLAQYLSQWDHGDANIEKHRRPTGATEHAIPGAGIYLLVTNPGIGFCTLYAENQTP